MLSEKRAFLIFTLIFNFNQSLYLYKKAWEFDNKRDQSGYDHSFIQIQKENHIHIVSLGERTFKPIWLVEDLQQVQVM
jgi:hypothetical protein